jgi:hypothetical protein
MSMTGTRRRLALAALLATAAIGSAAPASANVQPLDCDERLERIEDRFRQIEERRGYEAATEWWYKRWEAYHKRCVLG